MPKNQAKTNATIIACGGPDSSSSPRYDPIKGRNFGSQVTLRHMRWPYRLSSLCYDNPSGRVPMGTTRPSLAIASLPGLAADASNGSILCCSGDFSAPYRVAISIYVEIINLWKFCLAIGEESIYRLSNVQPNISKLVVYNYT